MTDLSYTADAVVVGGGPAGSSAAYFLARAGVDVMLVDKALFPRDKTCGDGCTPRSLEVLDRMGVREELDSRGYPRCTGVLRTYPGLENVVENPPYSDARRGYTMVAPRRELDLLLLQKAQEAGVRIMEGAAARGLIRRNGPAEGVRLSGGEIHARLVIAADGIHSVLAGESGLWRCEPEQEYVSVRAYYEDVDGLGDNLEIHGHPDLTPGYFWIFPAGQRRANAGLLISTVHFRQNRINIRRLFDRFVQTHPPCRRLDGARRAGPLKGWPIRFGDMERETATDGLMLVGDAAGFIDPLSGEGIYFALRSGELAARTAAAALERGDASAGALQPYQDAWRAEFGDDFRKSRLAKKLIQKPELLTRYRSMMSKG